MKIDEIINDYNRIINKKYTQKEIKEIWKSIKERDLPISKYVFFNVCALLNIDEENNDRKST